MARWMLSGVLGSAESSLVPHRPTNLISCASSASPAWVVVMLQGAVGAEAVLHCWSESPMKIRIRTALARKPGQPTPAAAQLIVALVHSDGLPTHAAAWIGASALPVPVPGMLAAVVAGFDWIDTRLT